MITTDILILVGPGLATVLKQVVKLKCHLIDALPQPGGCVQKFIQKKPFMIFLLYPEIGRFNA
jgi:thioredoxin reductase (NADPH)